MSAEVIDGKVLSSKILEEIKRELLEFSTKPVLTIIRVEGDPATEIYVRKKKEACDKVGIGYNDIVLEEDISQEDLVDTVEKFNLDSKTTGIIVQLPLPDGICAKDVTRTINTAKDVDGLNPTSKFVPATTLAIIKMLESIDFKFEGASAVVVGASDLVGKPTVMELVKRESTVTICHIKTKNIVSYTRNADLVVVAAGKPKLLTEEMVKEGAVVIDVGINKVDGKLVGDVDFENVKRKASYVSPVPGGVGPMTVACLLWNLSQAASS